MLIKFGRSQRKRGTVQVAEETASDTLDSAVTLAAPTQSLDVDRLPHTPYASVTGVGVDTPATEPSLCRSQCCSRHRVAPQAALGNQLMRMAAAGAPREQAVTARPRPLFMEPVHPQGSVARSPKKWPQDHVVRAPRRSGNYSPHVQTCSHYAVTYTDTILYVNCRCTGETMNKNKPHTAVVPGTPSMTAVRTALTDGPDEQ